MPFSDLGEKTIYATTTRSGQHNNETASKCFKTALQWPKPSVKVMVRVLGDRVWVGDSAHGNGGVRTDANDDAEVLADGFRAV